MRMREHTYEGSTIDNLLRLGAVFVSAQNRGLNKFKKKYFQKIMVRTYFFSKKLK